MNSGDLFDLNGKVIVLTGAYKGIGKDLAVFLAGEGGLTQLTKALAIEWASAQINVNAIAPTFIETPMTEQLLCEETFRTEVLERIPLGRFSKTKDLLGAVQFLSTCAADMVTDQTLVVDGGWTVW